MVRFSLEDFFDEFEHRPGLVNLASSDAQPWSADDLQSKDVSLAQSAGLTLHYPDVNAHLLPSLVRLYKLPTGIRLLPTSGAAEAIALVMHEYSAMRAAHGYRPVGIPLPVYGAFSGLPALLGLPIETYAYRPSRGWTPDPEEVLALARRCGALVVTNPHNPTGHVMPPEFLAQVALELSAHGGTLIVDEVFRVSGETKSAIGLGPHVVVIGSLSKTYGLPGLRLGWVAASEERLSRLRTVQQYLILTLNALTVALGAAILEKLERFSRADLIRDNRRILIDWAKAHEGVVSISAPTGGTTVCLTIDTAVGESALFDQFVEHGVLLAPGSRCFEFGHDVRWFRLGYATEPDTLRRGLEHVSAVLGSLQRQRFTGGQRGYPSS